MATTIGLRNRFYDIISYLTIDTFLKFNDNNDSSFTEHISALKNKDTFWSRLVVVISSTSTYRAIS
jgi:hypothetical protein